MLGAEVVAGRRPAAARSRTPSTRRCATGSPTSTAPTTCSARSPARTRSRRWSATSSGSSASRPARQMLELTGRLPDAVVACVGGGSNAIGHLPRVHPRRRACGSSASRPAATASRPASTRRRSPAARPASCTAPAPTSCRTRTGQTTESHSISAGLDYPGVGPEHACLNDTGRADVRAVTDDEAMDAFAPALPHRGHHPGHRERARAGRRAGGRAGSSAPDAPDPGQPVRAAATRTWTPPRATSGCTTADRRAGEADVEQDPREIGGGQVSRHVLDEVLAAAKRRGPGRPRSATCRPGSRPSTARIDAMRAMVERRRRHRRGRPAVLRPGDGRPGHPARRRRRPRAAAPRTDDVLRRSRGVAATGAADPRHDATGTRSTATASSGSPRSSPAAGGAGVITPDLTPDEAATPVRLAGATDATRPRTGSSWSRRPRPTSGSRSTAEHCRGFVYAASLMGVTGTRDPVGDAAEHLVAGYPRRPPTCRSASASACPTATRPPRSPPSPTA